MCCATVLHVQQGSQAHRQMTTFSIRSNDEACYASYECALLSRNVTQAYSERELGQNYSNCSMLLRTHERTSQGRTRNGCSTAGPLPTTWARTASRWSSRALPSSRERRDTTTTWSPGSRRIMPLLLMCCTSSSVASRTYTLPCYHHLWLWLRNPTNPENSDCQYHVMPDSIQQINKPSSN